VTNGKANELHLFQSECETPVMLSSLRYSKDHFLFLANTNTIMQMYILLYPMPCMAYP